MKIGQPAGKDFAYILGVYLGDGCVTKASSRGRTLCFKMNTVDEDFALAVQDALRHLTDATVSICRHDVKKSKKPNYSLYCGDDNLSRLLQAATDSKAKLPADLQAWSRELRLAFVAGLMDSEGFVARLKRSSGYHTNRCYYMGFKSCDEWVPEFRNLLESLGIRTGKLATEMPQKPGYKMPWRFHIKLQSWIDSGARFRIARKQRRVDEWASAPPDPRGLRFRRRSAPETNTLGALSTRAVIESGLS